MMNFKVFALIVGIILTLNATAFACPCETIQPFCSGIDLDYYC